MGDPTIPGLTGDTKTYSALTIAVMIVAFAVREWFKARNGKSGLLAGMAIVQAEDLAATTSIRQQLQEENKRLAELLDRAYERETKLRLRETDAEEALSAFLSEARDCPTPDGMCPARRLHEERRARGVSGKFPPLQREEGER